MRTFDKITDLIGGTPILKLNNYIALNELPANIYAKQPRRKRKGQNRKGYDRRRRG